jgi:hypothetical protein
VQSNRGLREGIVLGLIGYAAVAVFYAIFDVLAARGSLYTVNLLGLAVFKGLRDPSVLQLPVAFDGAAIGLFNGLHLIVALGIGFVVSWLVSQVEGPPAQARLALLSIGAGFLVTIFAIGMLSSPIRALLPWWSVVVANVLAVVVGGAYLLRRHPGLLSRVGAALT